MNIVVTSDQTKEQREFAVWNLFLNLGEGFKILLCHYPNPKYSTLWCKAPVPNPCHTDFRDLETIEPLLLQGLVEKVDVSHPDDSIQAEYKLTDKGKELFAEVATQMRQTGRQIFLSRVKM